MATDPASPAPPSPEPGADAACVILFVCTGNTCRSPLAAALCRRKLADRLGCPPHELPARGFDVLSAGVAASAGDAATPEAVAVAAEYGADLSGHRSRPVNPELLAGATAVVTMTRMHAAVLATQFPGVGPAPVLLCGPAGDLPDPIGGDLGVYRACAEVIAGRLDDLLAGLPAGRAGG